MKYALNLSEDNRILSICEILENGNYEGMPIVEAFPEGNTYEYLYIDGEYVYNPIPFEEDSQESILLEERVTELETNIDILKDENAILKEENAMLLECILEMSEIIYA